MPATENRAIVERFLAAAAARDAAVLGELAAPDLLVSEASSLPFGGEHVGLDAFRRLGREVFRLWEGTRMVVDRVIADGDFVVVMARLQGRSRVDGAAVEMPIVEVWELRDGRIRSVRPYYHDTHRYLATIAHATEGRGDA